VNRGAAPTIDSAYFRQALQLVSSRSSVGASQSVPTKASSETARDLLERNTSALLDRCRCSITLGAALSKLCRFSAACRTIRTEPALSSSFGREGASAPLRRQCPRSSGVADLMVRAEGGPKFSSTVYLAASPPLS